MSLDIRGRWFFETGAPLLTAAVFIDLQPGSVEGVGVTSLRTNPRDRRFRQIATMISKAGQARSITAASGAPE
jgi:hypothetical protein